MRIASVEVIPYALPFKEPYVTARGRLERREMVLLRIRNADGVVGLGEAVPLALRGGAGLEQIVRELEGFHASGALSRAAERWTKPGSFGLGSSTEEELELSPPARCAISTALIDLRARAGGSSALTAGTRSPSPPRTGRDDDRGAGIPCNATLVAGEPAAVAEDALRWAAEGFATFKLKLGVGEDAGQVRAVREAVGDDARIRVDANAAWDVETAKRVLAGLEDLDVELAEQPVATLGECAEVAAATSIPIAGDESIESRADAERAVELGACSLAGIKLSKVGGPEEATEIAAVLPSYVSSALDGPVGIAAGAQVARALRESGGDTGLAHGLATQRLFASTVAAVECELRDGMLHPPEGPGLGVEIDEAALEAHRL